MRDGNGAGLDGVSGAIGPEPADVIGGGDALVYANISHASQARSDNVALSFERVREMVDWAVERVRRDARRGQKANRPWWGPPGTDTFRRQFRHLMFDVHDVGHRAYIKKRFIRLWCWLQEKGKHHRRGGYSNKLRDEFFERGALRADICHLVGDGGRGGQPPAELAEMLKRHRGTDRFAAYFTSHPHLVEAYLPHVWDNDFPQDLAGVIRAYIPLAIECDPNKLTAFWVEHRNILDRLMEPLIKEAQSRVDALNAGAPAPEEPTRRLVEEEPAIVEEEPSSEVVKAAPDDDVSSEWKLRIGITGQLGAYILRFPSAIEQLRSNGFRAEYFGCDPAFLRDLFDITRLPADQWNRGLAELQRKYPAEHSRYLRLGEHLPALSSDELAEYFIPLAGIIQPNPAPVETDIERINSHTILEQEPPAAPLQSSPIEIDEQSPPDPAVEEPTPRLQRDITGSLVTSEDRLVGLVVRHRVPAADVQLKPEHFRDQDLRYIWKRWERLGSEVDQLDEDAIRARTDRWAVFAIWLIDVAGGPDPDNPIDPRAEIATLAEQIRGRTEEPPPPLAETDVVAILPPVPAAAPPEIVEEITPAPPAVEEASPPAPSCPTSSGNGHSDFVGFDVSEPPLPLDRASSADIEARNLQAALDLVKVDFPIFAARVDFKDGRWKKQPITKGWQVVRADQGRVRASWRQYPKAVPGIALGRAGLVVIDVDRHGGPDGVATFDKLVAEHGGLPPGPVVRTAGGGFHYYFRQPAGKRLGNHEGALTGCGINVRGHTGWVVGVGGVCPDGSEWRTADGAPSLVEAYRNGSIPEIPTWIVDMIRAPKSKKVPKERKVEPEAEATSDAAPPSSGKRVSSRSMDRRGKAWAETVLKNGAADLAAMPPHSGRNETANALGFQMGTTIARAWIHRDTVFNALWEACERNGLAVEESERTRDTVERAIDAGMLQPHPDLADGRTRAGRQRSGNHDHVWLKLRRIEVYRLLVIRHGEHATMRLVDDVLNGMEDLDAYEFGKRLNFTFDQYKEIGARFDRHPSTIHPYDATEDQTAAHRAAVRAEKKPARAEAEKARRLRKKQEEAQQPPTNDLVAQRCKAIVGFAKKNPGKHRTGELVRGLKRWDAFADITDKTRRNVIDELLRLGAAGKLTALTELLTVTKQTAKNRKPTFTVEHRK